MCIQALALLKHLLLGAKYFYIHLKQPLKIFLNDPYDNPLVGIGKKSMLTTCLTPMTLGTTLNF